MIKIKAKFKGVCSETGKTIAKGEGCLYYAPKKKVYHKTSNRFKNDEKIQAKRNAQSTQKKEKVQEIKANDFFSGNY